eukprot:3400663-Rhodomonas_salina.1
METASRRFMNCSGGSVRQCIHGEERPLKQHVQSPISQNPKLPDTLPGWSMGPSWAYHRRSWRLRAWPSRLPSQRAQSCSGSSRARRPAAASARDARAPRRTPP